MNSTLFDSTEDMVLIMSMQEIIKFTRSFKPVVVIHADNAIVIAFNSGSTLW